MDFELLLILVFAGLIIIYNISSKKISNDKNKKYSPLFNKILIWMVCIIIVGFGLYEIEHPSTKVWASAFGASLGATIVPIIITAIISKAKKKSFYDYFLITTIIITIIKITIFHYDKFLVYRLPI